MKPLILLRTSTEDQTPELQLRDIISMVSVKDPQIMTEQKSAWKENVKRPIMDQVISLIQRGKVKDLYVWDLDRIHRSRKRLCEFLVLCKHHGVNVHSYNQEWLESINQIPAPFNEIVKELLISILGWIGEEESGKKSKRVKMAIVRKDEGTFSYKGNKWGRKQLPSQTIRKVLKLSSQGLSIRKICAQVKVYNEDPSRGRNISIGSVQKILSENPPEKVLQNACI